MQKNNIYLLIILILTISLFTFHNEIQLSILNACELFITKIFPSLFPMFILTDLLIYLGLPELLTKFFGNIFKKIFHTSPYGAFMFFTSLFCGTPANAYVLKNLVNEKKLTFNEASYVFSFSFFTNPLFYLTMLNFIFKEKTLILKLFLIPYLANIITGILLRPKITNENIMINKKHFKSLLDTLLESIKKSMNTMLTILGTITIFFILNTIINPSNNPLISGFLEVSQGLSQLGLTNLTLSIKKLYTLLFVSFGGLSIFLQIKSILNDTNISLKLFLKARFLQGLISISLLILTNNYF